jgi:DNA invertase Pin-like site-specific DNA recombinase
MATVYGYARVSSRDQNLNRQLDALGAYGVGSANIYADHASGKDFDRPRYRELLHVLGDGDVLVVLSIDRLGRNYSEILEEWRRITKELGVAIVVLDMPLLDTRARASGAPDVTNTLIADIVLQLLSYVAQVERENIHRRQAEGIAAAQARGSVSVDLASRALLSLSWYAIAMRQAILPAARQQSAWACAWGRSIAGCARRGRGLRHVRLAPTRGGIGNSPVTDNATSLKYFVSRVFPSGRI